MCSFRSEINDRTILILDNFDSHVSAESFSYVEEELSSEISALPPNSTSICQPLDVGVMGPFKQTVMILSSHYKKSYINSQSYAFIHHMYK